jgi:acetate---CoA ligase (ADP-forming)
LKLPSALNRIISSEKAALDEHVSKELLRACGIPTVEETIVKSAEHAEETAIKFGYPVVMKGLLPGAVHKTEMNLVRLGISSGSGAAEHFRELTKQMDNKGKVLLQKQIPGKVELILGLVRDFQFGPCVMFGLGGISAEIFEDIVFGVAPLTLKEALDMINRISAQKILNGFRGEHPVDRGEIAKIIVRLGEMGIAFPQISEIDINPLICSRKGPVAVDATVILS